MTLTHEAASALEGDAADSDLSGVDRSDVDWALLRVRAYARRRVGWLRHIWIDEQESGQARLIADREVDGLLRDLDHPEEEARWWHSDASGRAHQLAIDEVEAAWRQHVEQNRWGALRSAMHLPSASVDVLQVLLAVQVEPAFARLCGYLHDDPNLCYPSAALIARLFGHDRADRGPIEALLQWGFVTEHPQRAGDPPALALDRVLVAWLTDSTPPIEAGVTPPPFVALEAWPLAETVEWIARNLSEGNTAEVVLVGEDGSGRRTFAAESSARLGLSLTLIAEDSHLHGEEPTPRARVREALLAGGAVAWVGAEALQHRSAAPRQPCRLEWVVVRPDERDQVPAATRSVTREVNLDVPSQNDRVALWTALVPDAPEWPEGDLRSLAARFRLLPGEIAAVGRQSPAGVEGAAGLVRAHSRRRIGRLAEVIESSFTWDDLIVGERAQEQLHDIEHTARAQPELWERPAARRLFPGGRGLLALFSGPPGTGKTMAAQVLAASLGVDLVRIDLSQVISKYIGETAQNLDRILRRAERMDVVLLFDEADAIFGRRTEVRDAHDRYANTDTAYLLQAMEQYPGLAVLSTNRKADIDPAFLRRFRFVVEFEKPGPEHRALMWERVLRELVGPRVWPDVWPGIRPALDLIAKSVEATGAQIKYAALAALLRAERDGMHLQPHHVLDAIGHELRKDGRTFTERDRERVLQQSRVPPVPDRPHR